MFDVHVQLEIGRRVEGLYAQRTRKNFRGAAGPAGRPSAAPAAQLAAHRGRRKIEVAPATKTGF